LRAGPRLERSVGEGVSEFGGRHAKGGKPGARA
jgi:hypothetical protein